MFLKGGRPPPPLQTHPHTHTMREKRRYNGYVFWLFSGGALARQPAKGGFQSLPCSHPATARRSTEAQDMEVVLNSAGTFSLLEIVVAITSFIRSEITYFELRRSAAAPRSVAQNEVVAGQGSRRDSRKSEEQDASRKRCNYEVMFLSKYRKKEVKMGQK